MPGKMKSTICLVLFMTLSCGCAPSLKKEAGLPQDALRQVRFFYPDLNDDLRYRDLDQAIEQSLEFLGRLDPDKIFSYGTHRFTCRQVIESHEAFREIIREKPDPHRLKSLIKRNFRLYRATGSPGKKDTLFTGYFEPLYRGSLSPDAQYRYPIYRKPDDLIRIDLSPFNPELKGQSIIARIEGKKLIPYYTRKDMEEGKALKGKGLEIAWLKDPVDVAFLHIQGSGSIRLNDGRILRVGYHAKNGRPYKSIGRYMLKKGLLTKKEMSMQAIRRYLESHPDILGEVLNHNPSYIFFRILNGPPQGNIGVPLTPGRSLALDSTLFPKGALAFISCEKPVLDSNGNISKWVRFSRFLLNQDTGGAIKGAGRADIFWGKGPYAEAAAGHMKHDGSLYILMKKP